MRFGGNYLGYNQGQEIKLSAAKMKLESACDNPALNLNLKSKKFHKIW